MDTRFPAHCRRNPFPLKYKKKKRGECCCSNAIWINSGLWFIFQGMCVCVCGSQKGFFIVNTMRQTVYNRIENWFIDHYICFYYMKIGGYRIDTEMEFQNTDLQKGKLSTNPIRNSFTMKLEKFLFWDIQL